MTKPIDNTPFPNSKRNLKIAVVHDHLGWCGGGERTVLLMALDLGADFITAYASPTTFPEYQQTLGSKLIVLSKRVIKTRVVRFFWLRSLFWWNRKLFKDYDLIIASAPTSTEMVAKFARKDALRITYTHTTPRRIFDKYEYSKKTYPLFLQPLFAVFVWLWRKMYIGAIMKFDFNIANSENVKRRIEQHLNTEANAVVWPPIMTDKFKWIQQGDYFLSWARIDELKRVELITKAFQKMPDKKIVIASGGPRLEIVKQLAQGYPNIKVVGWVEDHELAELVGNCQAAIYIPIDEDAGMTHLEANAAGKPVLGVAEGGLIETIKDGETGIMLPADPTENDIMEAVNKMTPEWCLAKKESCIQHAQKYSDKEFGRKIQKIVTDNDPRVPIIGLDASRWEDPRHPGQAIRTGVEVYSKHLIDNLVPMIIESGYRIRVYTPKTIPELPLQIQKVLPVGKRWTQLALSRELKYSPVDYFFTPSYYIPKHAPKKSYATIHDVEFKTNPQKYPLIEQIRQGCLTKINIKRAKRIITVSEFSKAQILKNFRISNDKIVVAHIGHDAWQDIDRGLMRDKTISFIGRIDKKKSLDVLIKAFASLTSKYPDWKLVLAGKPGFGYDELKSLINKLQIEPSVSMPGYISEQEKKNLLATSKIFVQPSSSEGSCIPLFEAWDADTPAILADTPLFKEVGGEGALYFKAGDDRSLATVLMDLIDNPDLQSGLVSAGREKLKSMSWQDTASRVLSIIIND